MPSSPSATCYITFEFSLGFEIKIICLPSIIPRLIALDSPFIPSSVQLRTILRNVVEDEE